MERLARLAPSAIRYPIKYAAGTGSINPRSFVVRTASWDQLRTFSKTIASDKDSMQKVIPMSHLILGYADVCPAALFPI